VFTVSLGKDTTYDGGKGNDTITGNSGLDVLRGGDGNDTIDGRAGNDILSGNDGNDDLFGGDGNDLLDGGAGNDRLYGEAGNDTLLGGDGNDWLDGGSGNDILNGGAGNDKLTGGAGSDVFVFGANSGRDTIADFNPGSDTIVTGYNAAGGQGDLLAWAANAHAPAAAWNVTNLDIDGHGESSVVISGGNLGNDSVVLTGWTVATLIGQHYLNEQGQAIGGWLH
jgi:Ca2+-binding RTX toxin-like protein